MSFTHKHTRNFARQWGACVTLAMQQRLYFVDSVRLFVLQAKSTICPECSSSFLCSNCLIIHSSPAAIQFATGHIVSQVWVLRRFCCLLLLTTLLKVSRKWTLSSASNRAYQQYWHSEFPTFQIVRRITNVKHESRVPRYFATCALQNIRHSADVNTLRSITQRRLEPLAKLIASAHCASTQVEKEL